ncbi:hypothetical protein VTO42DRAFT_7082 [Malbranchea cinnamomea]
MGDPDRRACRVAHQGGKVLHNQQAGTRSTAVKGGARLGLRLLQDILCDLDCRFGNTVIRSLPAPYDDTTVLSQYNTVLMEYSGLLLVVSVLFRVLQRKALDNGSSSRLPVSSELLPSSPWLAQTDGQYFSIPHPLTFPGAWADAVTNALDLVKFRRRAGNGWRLAKQRRIHPLRTESHVICRCCVDYYYYYYWFLSHLNQTFQRADSSHRVVELQKCPFDPEQKAVNLVRLSSGLASRFLWWHSIAPVS